MHIVAIPKEIVQRITPTSDFSYKVEKDLECLKAQAEIDAIGRNDPEEAWQKLWEEHYSIGAEVGGDWLCSSHYEDDLWWESVPHNVGDYGSPLEVVGWERSGYETGYRIEQSKSLWDVAPIFGNSDFRNLEHDPDFSKLLDILERGQKKNPRVGLFASHYDDASEVEEHPELGWRPLFCFDGPVSCDPVVDVHIVYYRQVNHRFEYAGIIRRWTF